MKFLCIIFIVCISGYCVAQELDQSYLDNLEDERLLALYDTHYGDSVALEKIARTYLDRARRQKDTIKMARGYDRLARTFHPKKNIAFADSVINLTANFKDKTYPAQGYILKGYEYAFIDFTKSTENYYIAYNYALKRKNLAQQLYLLNVLIIRKSYWGDSLEALKMQKNSYKLIKQPDFKDMMLSNSRRGFANRIDDLIKEMEFNALIGYVVCYLNLKQNDSAKYYLKRAKRTNHNYYGYAKLFNTSLLNDMSIEVYYFSKNYNSAILKSREIIENSNNFTDIESLYDAHLFKGLAHLKRGEKQEGIKNLIKADSIYEIHNFDLLPYRREVFVKLLEYYGDKQDAQKQLEYYGKITSIDSIFKKNYSFYDKSIKDEILTPKLLAQKDSVIKELQTKVEEPDPEIYILIFALFASLSVLLYYVRKRLVYKKRFEAIVEKNNAAKSLQSKNNGQYHNEIAPEVIEDILCRLNSFETTQGFLKPEITLGSLAKRCKTNSNYLSRVINLKIEKNFSQYLHELRIGHAMKSILSDATMRKYTIKAIAEECGYKSAESFSRAFYKINGIYPSYYIAKIEKSKKSTSLTK